MALDIEKLRELVIESGLSYSELSEKSGISKTHISRIINLEVKNVRTKTIKALCDALEIKCSVILEKAV